MRALQRNKRAEVQVAANAAGAATAIVPVVPGPSWEVKQISITSNSVLNSTAATYVGMNTAGIFISSTLLGNSDTDSLPNVTVRSGESICCVWAGCTVSSVCRITVIYDEVDY